MLFSVNGEPNLKHIMYLCNVLHMSTGFYSGFYDMKNNKLLSNNKTPCPEPYPNYLSDQISTLLSTTDTYRLYNNSGVYYMPYDDLIIHYCVAHKGIYKGTLFIGPLKLSESSLDQVKRLTMMTGDTDTVTLKQYLDSIPVIYQVQLRSLQDLIEIVAATQYYKLSRTNTNQLKPLPELSPSSSRITGEVKHHNFYQEEQALKNIFLSDDNFSTIIKKDLGELVYAPLASEPIRSLKNSFIIGTSTIARMAIRLGLDSESAFTYSDYFIKRVEELTTTEEISLFQDQMIHFYKKEVQKAKERKLYSPSTNALIDYVTNNLQENHTLKQITDQLNLNYKYTSKKFCEDTGITFTRYYETQKLAMAKKLLATTTRSINEIADFVGYSYAYYFTRQFQHHFGMTPSEYRKNMRFSSN